MKSSNIGGQAVIEGVMMRHGSEIAVAVRKPDGEIAVKCSRGESLTKKYRLFGWPVVRGVVAFIDSLVTGMKTLSYSASFYEEGLLKEEQAGEAEPCKSRGKKDGAASEKSGGSDIALMAVSLVLGLVIAIALFMVAPYYVSTWILRLIGVESDTLLALIEGIIKLIIFFGYLIAISCMNDIKRTFMYHGAEHKCINCIESGLPLNVSNVMVSSREHRRCGTSFLFFVVIISIILYIFIRVDTAWLRIVIRILLLPVVAGLSYEFIKWAGNSDSKAAYVLSRPGMLVQKLTTREPEPAMAEVGIVSVEAVFDWKAWQAEQGYLTYKSALDAAAEAFKKKGIESFETDALRLLEAACSIDEAKYLSIRAQKISAEEFTAFDELVKRRLKREPCQYIIGSTEFMGLNFKVNRSVLIPRQDTEILAEAALEAAREMCSVGVPSSGLAENAAGEEEIKSGGKIKILDLCAGSGAIAVSLAKFLSEDADVFASDISDEALALAAENARVNGVDVKFFEGDLFDFNPSVRFADTSPFRGGDLSVGDSSSEAGTLDEPVMFNMIVCNPPYVSESEYKDLAPEIRNFEPGIALLAGEDGLDFYRRIAADAASYLNAGGKLLLEIGSSQAEDVSEILDEAGFTDIECIKDFSGLDRVISCTY